MVDVQCCECNNLVDIANAKALFSVLPFVDNKPSERLPIGYKCKNCWTQQEAEFWGL